MIKQKFGNTFTDFELSIKDNGAKYRQSLQATKKEKKKETKRKGYQRLSKYTKERQRIANPLNWWQMHNFAHTSPLLQLHPRKQGAFAE